MKLENLTGRVARREQTLNVEISNLETIVLADFLRQSSNAVITAVNDQCCTKRRDELFVPAYKRLLRKLSLRLQQSFVTCVIPMMVSSQDRLQSDVLAFHRFQYSFGINRINDCRFLCLVADNQIHVVVR